MKKGMDYLLGGAKQRLDKAGALCLGAALLPPALFLTAASAIDTRKAPFYLQERVGEDGSLFRAIKFRTLVEDPGAPATHGTFDPRASRWGEAVRRSALDEIPQLVNVLAGDMSLVGVRPMRLEDIERMAAAAPDLFEEWYTCYTACPPGLAGPSQVYRHHFRDGTAPGVYRESAELDLRYFNNATFLGDLGILARTPLDVFMANRGIVENLPAAAQK